MSILPLTKSKINLSLLFFLLFYVFKAQIGIGTKLPHESTILDIVSTNKGISLPNIELTSESDVTTITNPKKGLMVYHTASSSSILPEGIYYNSGESTNAIWTKFNPYSKSHSSIVTLPFSASDPSKTLAIGDIEIRYNKATQFNQIRFTNLAPGENLKYTVFIIENWEGRGNGESETRAGTCSAKETFDNICNSTKQGFGENNEIWIYVLRNGIYSAYRYDITLININSTSFDSKIIEKF
ncbi:hypothetical protein UJ101_01254 [Flavobacteriaceae bacterium UJ101]|nr:hypothetical protein UJ101_01254 [Flavobacteriaceae bacterium UJ101]